MAYIGKAPNTAIVNQATSQSFSGNGSTTAFTLNRSVNVGEDLEVFVNNVQQEPGSGKSYTASGTTLTFDEAPPSGTNNVYVIYRGEATINPRLEHDANAALAATTGTFSGDLTVDTNTLKVDSSNNRVGINTNSPSFNFHATTSTGSDFAGFFQNTAGSGNGTSLVAKGGANNASPNFQVQDFNGNADFTVLGNGSVGIGATPSVPFEVKKENAGFQTILDNDNGSAKGLKVRIKANDSGDFPVFQAVSASSGSDKNVFTIFDDGSVHITQTANRGLKLSSAANGSGQNDADAVYDAQDTEGGGTGSHVFKIGGSTKTRFNQAGTIISENVTAQNANLELNGASTNGYYNVLMNGNANNGYKVLFKHGSNSVGSIITTNSNTSYNTSSDHRLKENVADMTGAIARVKQLSPKRFSWIVDELDAANVDGFLAHEAQAIVPEAVTGNKDAVDDDDNPVYQQIDQSKLIPLLTGALREAITKIETLETKVAALEGN